MIVVDASVLTSFVLTEPGWEKFIELLKSFYTVDHAVKEVSNAIWKAYKRGIVSAEDSILKFQALKKLVNVNAKLVDEKELIEDAFRLALEQGITVYDSLYIVLALKLRAPLATLDRVQIKIAEKLGVKTISF